MSAKGAVTIDDEPLNAGTPDWTLRCPGHGSHRSQDDFTNLSIDTGIANVPRRRYYNPGHGCFPKHYPKYGGDDDLFVLVRPQSQQLYD